MREPGLELGKSLGRRPGQSGVSPCGTCEGAADESFGEEFAVRVPGMECDDVIGSAPHGARVQWSGDLGCPQGCCLPAVVGGPGSAISPDESSNAGPALNQALRGECPEGLLDGDRAGLVLSNELAR